MRLRWLPDNSVALCADNFARLSRFSSAQQLYLMRSASVPILFSHNHFKIDVQQTPQISNKMVKELITLEREYMQNYEKIFTGGDRKKK